MEQQSFESTALFAEHKLRELFGATEAQGLPLPAAARCAVVCDLLWRVTRGTFARFGGLVQLLLDEVRCAVCTLW